LGRCNRCKRKINLKEVIFIPEFVNCTPHDINLYRWYNGEAVITVIPRSGIVPRLKMEQINVTDINDVPIYITKAGPCEDLPEYKPGKILIVSRMIAEAYPDRGDFVFPHETVRDDEGRIIGCKSFAIARDL
jgi:hypothetical protein